MKKPNYNNEVVKREFFEYLRNSSGFAENSTDALEKAILYWEEFTNKADFSSFDSKQPVEFRDWIKSKKRKGSEKTVSLSYSYDMLRHLRTFFSWLSKQPGYKSKINPNHIDFLNLSKKDSRVATQSRTRKIPSFADILQVLEHIPGKTEVEMRDRALISFIMLTAARISAVVSLPMKSFDRIKLVVDQNPSYGVKTKFSKRIPTALFRLPDKRLLAYFLEWFDYLEKERHFGQDDPIFPSTKLQQGKENINFFSSGKVEPLFWSDAGSARKIFEKRFKQAGLAYYNPHTLRHLIISELSKAGITEEQKKAISQNFGHENIGTTFGSYGYGQISEERQIDLIQNLNFTDQETKNAMQGLSEEDIRRILKEELKKSRN